MNPILIICLGSGMTFFAWVVGHSMPHTAWPSFETPALSFNRPDGKDGPLYKYLPRSLQNSLKSLPGMLSVFLGMYLLYFVGWSLLLYSLLHGHYQMSTLAAVITIGILFFFDLGSMSYQLYKEVGKVIIRLDGRIQLLAVLAIGFSALFF